MTQKWLLQVVFAWAASIEPDKSAQLLIKLGLLNTAINFALELVP